MKIQNIINTVKNHFDRVHFETLLDQETKETSIFTSEVLGRNYKSRLVCITGNKAVVINSIQDYENIIGCIEEKD